MKCDNKINLVTSSLFSLVLVSQLTACDLVASATGTVADVQNRVSTDANNTETSVVEFDADNVVNEGEMIADEGGNIFDGGGNVIDEGGSVIDEGGSVIDGGGNIIDEGGNNTDVIGGSTINKTLSWTAPVTRENGSAISMNEIAGFRVYYSTIQGVYKQYSEINDAYIAEVKLSNFNLQSAKYYVVITTIDTSGRESVFSKEVFVQA